MPDINLPLTASAAEIADAIRRVQARCKKGLCSDPDGIAGIVREQLDRGQSAAAALCCTLAQLEPDPCSWSGHRVYDSGDETCVRVTSSGIRVHRGAPFSGHEHGRLTLHLPRPR